MPYLPLLFPSFEVFVPLMNALDCSADEIICKELQTARPIVNSWLPDPFHGNTSFVE